MSDSVKITYLIVSFMMDVVLLLGMVLTPVYITPGLYVWSGIAFVLLLLSSFGQSYRLDQWGR